MQKARALHTALFPCLAKSFGTHTLPWFLQHCHSGQVYYVHASHAKALLCQDRPRYLSAIYLFSYMCVYEEGNTLLRSSVSSQANKENALVWFPQALRTVWDPPPQSSELVRLLLQ